MRRAEIFRDAGTFHCSGITCAAFVAAYIHASRKWPGDPQRCLDFSLTAAMLKNSIIGDCNLVTEGEILSQMP